MVAWTASTVWFQRRLAAEYDKSSRLERTVEQLAKQHRALETQFYSSYTSLTSNRTTSPLSSDLRGPSPAIFQRGAARRMPPCLCRFSYALSRPRALCARIHFQISQSKQNLWWITLWAPRRYTTADSIASISKKELLNFWSFLRLELTFSVCKAIFPYSHSRIVSLSASFSINA